MQKVLSKLVWLSLKRQHTTQKEFSKVIQFPILFL
uniref:Uncharacterized protein n=1 Tax=Siphoviridae sp. cteoh1 TaxID=2826407 RepID=A0A8S5QL18_9CAUD|nr:MAG TPA: hypothetical protein [Siphoviridae sp. cteoh1]